MKRKEARADSDIPENKEDIKMYRYGWTIVIYLLTVLSLLSCRQERAVTAVASGKSEKKDTVSEQEYQYVLTEATRYKVVGNLKQAAALYKKCIEVKPGGDVAYYQMGKLYIQARDLEQAKKYSKKALELRKDNYWYYAQLISIYDFEGNRDSVIILYEQMNKMWPDNAEIQFDLARKYTETGKYEKAMELLNEIEINNGFSQQIGLLKEQVYDVQGEKEKAAGEVLKMLEIFPDDVRFLGLLAELYTEMGKEDQALELYGKIFDIEPDNGVAQVSLAEFYRKAGNDSMRFEFLEKAFMNEKLSVGRKIEVVVGLLQEEKEMEQNGKEIEKLIGILMEKYPEEYRINAAYGDFLIRKNRLGEAIVQFEKILDMGKANYYVWEQLEVLYNLKDNQEKVYSTSSEAIKRFPDRPLSYLFKGNVETTREEYDRGIATLKEGLKNTTGNDDLKIRFYTTIAEAYRSQGNDRKSDEYFDKVLTLDPGNLLVLNNYSYYLALREERLKEAEKMSRTTIEAEPLNPTYLDTYAWILYKQGKEKKALSYIRTAVENGGSGNSEILTHYGDILSRLGREKEAEKYWNMAKQAESGEEISKNKKEE